MIEQITALLQRLRACRLIRRTQSLDSTLQVIGWWEARRLPFNLIIGITGVVTSICILLIGIISKHVLGVPIGIPDPPFLALIAVIIYGVAANACYTGGWIAEIVVKKAWPNQADEFGTLAFTLGLSLSILLTLAPIVLIGFVSIGSGIAALAGYEIATSKF